MKQNKRDLLFARCFYGYAVSGMTVLVFGSILPFIMEEAGLNYALAGALLSTMAIGNLTASFVFPIIIAYFGKRIAIVLITALMPAMLFWISLLPSLSILYVCMFLIGIGKGSITIFNNAIVNDYSVFPAKTLNYLHCSYAVGAFLAPFLTGLFTAWGLNWKMILYLIILLGITSCLFYGSQKELSSNNSNTHDFAKFHSKHTKPTGTNRTFDVNRNSSSPAATPFYHSFDFFCISFLLFFYLGLENCVNGWFVTYLQSKGIMSEAFASVMVSITWLCIMAGRLCCAALSQKMPKSRIVIWNCIGSALGLLILITGKEMMQVGLGLILLGLFMSGIFPTSVAIARPFIKGSTTGMSTLTAISSLGGILAPQLIGMTADYMGISGAIGLLFINGTLMLLLSAVLRKRIPA